MNDFWLFQTAEDNNNYNTVYQYDQLGLTSTTGNGSGSSDTGWFSNVFTATDNEAIKAISFPVLAVNSSYEISIYTNVTSDPINGNIALSSQSGTIQCPGYHTISLNSPVSITKNTNFSVIIKMTTPGYYYPIPIEKPIANYSSQSTASYGESYISLDGLSWYELTGIYSNANVCIKAFSTSNKIDSVSLSVNPGSPQSLGTPITLTASATGSSSPLYRLFIKKDAGNWSMVRDYDTSSSYVWTPSEAGSYTFEVHAKDSSSSADYEAYTDMPFTIASSSNQVTNVSLSTDKDSPQSSETSITLTASASGSSSPLYRLFIKKDAGNWSMVRDYDTSSSYVWTPSEAGSYTFEVHAKDSSSSADYEAYTDMPFLIASSYTNQVNN